MDNDPDDRHFANLMFELEAISSTVELVQNIHAQAVFGDRLLNFTSRPIDQMKFEIRKIYAMRAHAMPMSVHLHVGQAVDACNARRQSDPVSREEWTHAIGKMEAYMDHKQQELIIFEETMKQKLQEKRAKMRMQGFQPQQVCRIERTCHGLVYPHHHE